MTAEEAVNVIAQELATSNDVELKLGNGEKVSLRRALAEILWKEVTPLPVHGDPTPRPVPPEIRDDQYGHVLSARGELNTLLTLGRAAAVKGSPLTGEEYDSIVKASIR